MAKDYRGNNNSRNDSYSQNNAPAKKHSGAKMTKGRQAKTAGEEFITAWIYRKKTGLNKIICMTKGECAKNENQSLIYYCTVQSGFQKLLFTGFWDEKRRCLRIPEIGFGIYPYAPNGGYCGFYSEMKSKR